MKAAKTFRLLLSFLPFSGNGVFLSIGKPLREFEAKQNAIHAVHSAIVCKLSRYESDACQ